MSNSSIELHRSQDFQAYAEKIDLRISTLEQELTHLKDSVARSSVSSYEQPWWITIAGSCADNPLFEDAVRYGQEWRNSVE